MFKKKIEVKNEILKRMELTDNLFLLIDDMSEIQTTFQSIWTYLKSFFDILYKSPKFISRLISLSKLEDIKNNLAPFFMNNFFENILSSQSLENNLISIIYFLLKEEIDSLPNFNSPEKFLENTPCGLFLEQLIEKIDIRTFCRINIIKVVKDIEWTFSGKKICLDVQSIIESLNRQQQNMINNTVGNNSDKQTKKANVHIKKSYSIFSAYDGVVENNKENNSVSLNRLNSYASFDGFGEKEFMKQKKNSEDSQEFNSKYIIDIDPKQYEKDSNNYIKEFIQCQTERNKNNWSLNSNEAFISNVFKGEQSEEIISIYILSFIKVIESINLLFQNLLENTGIIPYSIKCICKMIYILLQKKFPNINRLQLNAFMSRFFFNKLFLPFFENPIFGALINEYMISPETVTNIKIISEVFSKICLGQLYTQEEDKGNYTPFNKFIIEKINDVYNFFKNIEEVILPEFITKINNDENINEYIDNEPFVYESICFNVEELYAMIINISKNKEELFKEEKYKTLSIIFKKIDKPVNIKAIEDIMNEKIYENIPGEENNNDNKKKNKSKKKKSKEIKRREIKKFYLINELIINDNNYNIYNIKKEKAQFQIKELKKTEKKEDLEKNNLIKIKNILCTILYYLREINIYDFNPINESLSDTSHIFKEIKKFIKNSYFRIDDSIPFDWYVSSFFQCINKLPHNYVENDYELLYEELKLDIINSIKSFDINILSNISDKIKYGIRKKKFYQKAEKRLVDISLNEKVQYILDQLRIPCELYFCYNDKEKKINIKELKKDDNTVKFLDAMIFAEQSRYIKTCHIIKDFTRYFPNIVKSSLFFGENESILEMLKNLEIPKIINNYLNIIKSKLQQLKIFTNEDEFKDINNKIYDFVMEKINDKIFPTFQSNKDSSLHEMCVKLTWTEPKNFIPDNKDYIFDSFLPDVVHNFSLIEEEKSPRKKLEYMRRIFVCINQVQNFNGSDGSKAGVDDIINILAYAFVKAQPNMANTNIEYLKFFVNENSEEDHFLTQLSVVNEFILKATHEKLRVTKEEFEENCKKSLDEFLK